MFFVLYFLLLVFSILVYMLYLAIQHLGRVSNKISQSVISQTQSRTPRVYYISEATLRYKNRQLTETDTALLLAEIAMTLSVRESHPRLQACCIIFEHKSTRLRLTKNVAC